jgi:hypothetical protein
MKPRSLGSSRGGEGTVSEVGSSIDSKTSLRMVIGSPCSRGQIFKGVTYKGSASFEETNLGATVKEWGSPKVIVAKLDLVDDTKLKSSKDLLAYAFFEGSSNGALPLFAFIFSTCGVGLSR